MYLLNTFGGSPVTHSLQNYSTLRQLLSFALLGRAGLWLGSITSPRRRLLSGRWRKACFQQRVMTSKPCALRGRGCLFKKKSLCR